MKQLLKLSFPEINESRGWFRFEYAETPVYSQIPALGEEIFENMETIVHYWCNASGLQFTAVTC